MQSNKVFHFMGLRDSTALEALHEQSGLSEDFLRDLFTIGAVYLEKKRLFDPARPIRTGTYLRLHSQPRRYQQPVNLAAQILHENEHWIVLDKPPGVPCHATVDNGIENLISWMGTIRGAPFFITHRLDLPTSGCLVLAKNPEGASRFNKLMLKGRVEKEYEVLVEGDFQHAGMITHWMKDEEWAPRSVEDEHFFGSLECRLEILEKENWGPISRVRVKLHTGRTHQIRVQMSHLGHPVLNDKMYGAKILTEEDRIGLRAARLSYTEDPDDGLQSYDSKPQWPEVFLDLALKPL